MKTRVSLPVSLIVDDGSPVNPLYWLHPDVSHEFHIPASFVKQFGEACQEWGVKGKWSLMPMPSGLGRIDKKLNYVSSCMLQAFLLSVRHHIAPNFDITPEVLTHQAAVNLSTGKADLHLFEDEWFARATLSMMTEYLALALDILRNVGLPANGVTSPWATGIQVEKRYAEAIGLAQWRVNRRRFSWYFLHCRGKGKGRWPWVTWNKEDRTVISVAGNTDDYLWGSQRPATTACARKAVKHGVDNWLSQDGKAGRLRELFDDRKPLTIVTHWQSLFSDGRGIGLAGLSELFRRIRDIFGDQVTWMTCSQLARSHKSYD